MTKAWCVSVWAFGARHVIGAREIDRRDIESATGLGNFSVSGRRGLIFWWNKVLVI